jgi:hypothetical protein
MIGFILWIVFLFAGFVYAGKDLPCAILFFLVSAVYYLSFSIIRIHVYKKEELK